MDFFIQHIIPYLLLYKYVTIFIIAFMAAFIVPIPSGNVLMIASGFASVGYFNLSLIIIISIIANILGDNLGYWVARKYGVGVLSKIGFGRILKSKVLQNIEEVFNNRPGFIIFLSRFEVLSTLSVNLLSGLSKTNYRKYFIHESLGSIAQVTMYSLIGYFFADSWGSINTTIGRIALVGGLILIILLISFGGRSIKKKISYNK